MRNVYFTYIITLALCCFNFNTTIAQPKTAKDVGVDVYFAHYSEWMANTVCFNQSVYHNDNSIVAEAMLDTWLAYPDHISYDVREAVKNYAALVNEEGTVADWNADKASQLDYIRPGRFFIRYYNLIDKQKDEKFTKFCSNLLDYLGKMGRTMSGSTPNGPWFHKSIAYPNQVWLDGSYMGIPFYSLAGPELKSEQKEAIFTDAVTQLELIDKVTYDQPTDLWRHGWDENCKTKWACKEFNYDFGAPETYDKTSGRSSHAWGRAMGWYAMACLEVLDNMEEFEIPHTDKRYQSMLSLFGRIMNSVKAHQDPTSNLWYCILDVAPNDAAYRSVNKKRDNYIEATASAMFTYCMLRGYYDGYLTDASYFEAGKKAYCSMIKTLVQDNRNNGINLAQCCKAGGLNNEKDGSFAYYMNEDIVMNDNKGVAPFIWASLAAEKMGYDMLSNSFSKPYVKKEPRVISVKKQTEKTTTTNSNKKTTNSTNKTKTGGTKTRK